MKLLLVTSLKEYQKTVANIMERAGIEVFSVSETVGFKEHDKSVLLNNWFSSGSEQADAIFLFSFTENSKSEHALKLIHKHNIENNTGFPIRAFILPVEKSTYDLI
jgi:hypothetical protein